jgi:hypothetical protein
LVLAAGVLVHTSLAQAPKKGQPEKKDTKKPTKDTKDTKTTKETRPAGPRTKAIHLPPDVANDVRDLVGVINTQLEAAWKENKLTPSRNANDYEFIRRVSLDIVGRVAKPEEIAQFLKDPKEYRRTRLIDRLLASPDYPRHWANVWTNWLLSRAGIFGRGMYHQQMATWLEDQFAQNRPYHEIVRDLITAKGKNSDNGAVNFADAPPGRPRTADSPR